MAYKTKDLYQKALDVIDRYNLFFIEDIVAYIGISKPTFYEHFPIDSNEMNDIKDRIEKKKVQTKVSIRGKLHSSTNTAGLLALYKLICTEDERKALAMEYKETTNNNKHSFEVTPEIVDKVFKAYEDEWE